MKECPASEGTGTRGITESLVTGLMQHPWTGMIGDDHKERLLPRQAEREHLEGPAQEATKAIDVHRQVTLVVPPLQ